MCTKSNHIITIFINAITQDIIHFKLNNLLVRVHRLFLRKYKRDETLIKFILIYSYL